MRKGTNCSIRPFISTHNFQPKCPQRQLKLSPTRTSHSPCSPQFLLSNSEIHLSWMSPVTHCYLNEQLSSLQCQHLQARASQAALVVKKKNLLANAGDLRDVGSVPGSGRSPGGGIGNPLQNSSWRTPWTEGYGPWGRKGSDMTEATQYRFQANNTAKCIHENKQTLTKEG